MAEHRTIAQRVAVATPQPAPLPILERVHYPDSDGRFLPENPLQQDAILNLRFALEHHFLHVDRVVLRGDIFVYYEEGNPGASIAPDVFVVLDHDLGGRSVYKIWEEGKSLDFALEVISPSSAIRNAEEKRGLYELLGIREYFLFQPDPRRRGRRLVGYQLWGDSYQELPLQPGGALSSAVLGVSMRVEGTKLRVRSLESGRDYAWIRENLENLERSEVRVQAAVEAQQRAEARAQAAAAARRSAEATATAEAAARRSAEAAATTEAAARRSAEAKARELEEQLKELAALLGQHGPGGPEDH